MKGGVFMRPLIEILEDERTLVQKLESVHRYMLRTDDTETIDILVAQERRVNRDLEKVHAEIKEYLINLCK